jgi:hypothetical protein
MKCTILNRNYPPDSGITGNSANELAGYLVQAGIDVRVITTGGNYQGGGALDAQVHGTVQTVGHLYNGKNKILRLFSSFVEGWKMARKAVTAESGPILCMTDPPLLNYWVSRKAHRRSIPWIYWAMDLYPEAFRAIGVVKAQNPIYQFLKRRLLQARPAGLIALGPKQAEFIQREYPETIPTVILPCGITQSREAQSRPAWAEGRDKIRFGYAGNIGEAHDERFIMAVIDAINPAAHHFVLCAYGAKAKAVLDYAQGREGVTIVDTVAREHLQLIDVHVVTLIPQWDHVCVPSKAVSAVCEGGSVLMCCSDANDNWALLKDAGWRIDVDADLNADVGKFITQLTDDELQSKRAMARQLSTELLHKKEDAFADIAQMIKSLQT